jgi:hypothetical protein
MATTSALAFRCVDKIYDWGRSKTLTRLKDAVPLAGLRCNGSAHGGSHSAMAWRESTPGTSRYTYQYTQLSAASWSGHAVALTSAAREVA